MKVIVTASWTFLLVHILFYFALVCFILFYFFYSKIPSWISLVSFIFSPGILKGAESVARNDIKCNRLNLKRLVTSVEIHKNFSKWMFELLNLWYWNKYLLILIGITVYLYELFVLYEKNELFENFYLGFLTHLNYHLFLTVKTP